MNQIEGLRPVTWHQAYLEGPILARLRIGGPLHEGRIAVLGKRRCVLLVDGRRISRRYGEFFWRSAQTPKNQKPFRNLAAIARIA